MSRYTDCRLVPTTSLDEYRTHFHQRATVVAMVLSLDFCQRIHIITDRHGYESAERKSARLEPKFARLAEKWVQETRFTSSISRIRSHPAYLQIIAMGWTAVPLMLAELRARPNHWFTALRAITEENPVLREHRGNVTEMSKDWLAWGEERGFR